MTNPRLRVEQRGPAQVALFGVIDEHANLPSIVSSASGGHLLLDLAGITFINSLGVRDWIRLQAAATQAGISLHLDNVTEPIVHQLNMIIATRGKSTVRSFFAPFACDNCGREDSLLIDVASGGASLQAGTAPTKVCQECGAPMAFNDFPERYFAFLRPE
jgi:hypothetical protein